MHIILRGRDVHTNRLELGLKSLGQPYMTALDPAGIPHQLFDIAFIDPSFNYDVKVMANKTVFYDCEDGPEDFYPGVAWETQKCSTYVKMNYVDNPRDDGLKLAAFPLYTYPGLIQASRANLGFGLPMGRPFFIGHPTFIGKYSTPDKVINKKNKLGIKILSDEGCYNQRYDWVTSLLENEVPANIGIVFSKEDNNMSLKYQQTHYGEVEKLEAPAITYLQQLNLLSYYGIGLSPTGHERLSWRFLDIMATGAVLIITDYGKQRSMYMPKEAIIVKDEEDISIVVDEVMKNYKEYYKAHQKNKEFFKNLTPDKIWLDFVRSLE